MNMSVCHVHAATVKAGAQGVGCVHGAASEQKPKAFGTRPREPLSWGQNKWVGLKEAGEGGQ